MIEPKIRTVEPGKEPLMSNDEGIPVRTDEHILIAPHPAYPTI